MDTVDTTMRRGRKSLDEQRNEAARDYIRAIVEQDFKGNVSAAAVEFDVKQPTLSNFLNGKSGAGISLLDGVASYRNVSLDVVLGRAKDEGANRNKRLVMETPEFERAPAPVREAFESVHRFEGDQSVVAWALYLDDLIRLHERGRLETRGGRPLVEAHSTPNAAPSSPSRPNLRLLELPVPENDPEHVDEDRSTLPPEPRT
jgi:hypothetical protein